MKWLAVLAFGACAFTQDREAALGEHIAESLRTQTHPAAPAIAEYVRGLAARIAPGVRMTVETVSGDIGGGGVAALWAPGYLFVPARAVALARSEAELAGVLAHAMAHRTDRWPMWTGEGAPLDREMSADRETIATMAALGYNPRAFRDYLGRVTTGVTPRLRALDEALAAMPARADWVEDTSAFREAHERARAAEPTLPRKQPSLYSNGR